MQLGLGTVQFGIPYGLARRKPLLPDGEIRRILAVACERGVTLVDTAPAYGDIESRLGSLCEGLDFKFTSKIPAFPVGLDGELTAHWALDSARTSYRRLGRKLHALLFHRVEDLLGERGAQVWSAVLNWAKRENIKLGASGYDVETLVSVHKICPLGIAQLPGNAFDQQIAGHNMMDDKDRPELHLRSAFLQGLLLLPYSEAIERMPGEKNALQNWHRWLTVHELDPLSGALSVIKGFKNVAACVVGVDNIDQLMEITDTWKMIQPLNAEELASRSARLIDPRLWDDVA